MSDYRFGLDDYSLNYYPKEAANEDYGVDWDKVESVEIEWIDFVRERTCELRKASWDDGTCTWGVICSECGYRHEHESGVCWNYCPNCGAKVVNE